MRQQQKIFASPLRICAIALTALCIAFAAPRLALATFHSRLTTLEDLYALGLSTQAGEKAEDILLRAHAGDSRAMALATVGYDLGINGFPAHRMLSCRWGKMPFEWNAAEMSCFLSAYWSRYFPLREEDDRVLELHNCAEGRRSPLAPLFKKAGLFDVEQRRAEILPEAKPLSPEEEANYKSLAKSHEEMVATNIEYIKRFRAATERVLADDEEEFLFYHLQISGHDIRRLIYYMATTHDVNKDASDFQPERLLRFAELRSLTGPKESAEMVSMELMNWLSQDREEIRALIRRAHNGEAAAMRRMAVNYLGGEMGFLYSPGLAWEWYECAAMKGDSPSMLIMAEKYRLLGPHDEAWIWAKLAEEYGDKEQRNLAAWILRAVEARISPEALSTARVRLAEYREKIESGRTPKAAHEVDAPF